MKKSLMRQKDVIGDQIYKASIKACRNQVLLFAKIIKRIMLESGVKRDAIDGIVKKGFKGYEDMTKFRDDCLGGVSDILQVYLQPNDRGRDVLGRLAVEFSFVRPRGKGLLREDGDEADLQAREEFVKGVLPRPLLGYFLVSIRGTIEGIDDYKCLPMIFGYGDPELEERRKRIMPVIDEHRKIYAGDKRITDWTAVYRDKRCRRESLEFIIEITRRIADLGQDRYLKILDNIQRKESSHVEPGLRRLVRPEDVKQIVAGLNMGAQRLKKALGE